jgi:predicted Fe-Mo cluster-binding NifX family protein
MKICISSTGKDLNSQVDTRFGRSNYFLLVDIDKMSFESISNESANNSGGAGIQAAQTLANTGVEVVITGNVGPNAYQTLSAAGIKIITGVNGTVKDAIEKYKKGELKNSESANVTSHFGMKVVGKGFGRG